MYMDKLRQCGAMYIKFDEQNNPEYGFVVDDNVISKFYSLCDRQLEKISLPVIQNDYIIPNEEMAHIWQERQEFVKNKNLAWAAMCDNVLLDYAKGSVRIARDCFAGIKKLQIVAPVDYSVMLDWGCFEKESQIELLLPSEMGLKQVHRMFDTGFDYKRENWTLIAHQNFNFTSTGRGDSYDAIDFSPSPKNCNCQISVKHLPAEKLHTCLIGNSSAQIAKGTEQDGNTQQR